MTDSRNHPAILDELADLARVLGHPHRLILLRHVAEGERAVEQLVELSGLAMANASQHLQHLRRAGFVQTRRDGKRVLYRLGTGPIESVLTALHNLAEYRRAEIQALIADSASRPDLLESITRDELVRRLRDEAILLLDVRPEEEYAAGHLPRAINIPATELERRLAELPRDKVVVAYCRGPQCVLSANAMVLLRARGRAARHFEGGFPDWQAAGLDVEGRNYDSG